MKPFKPAVDFLIGSNFATTCDILKEEEDKYLVTGHRGFNNSGAEVKLWDLRSFSKENLLFSYDKHAYTPESTRFAHNSNNDPLILSASKD